MRKYPVLSKSGNKYDVKLFMGESIIYAGFNIVISRREQGLFGRSKNVQLQRYNVFKTEKEMLETYRGYVGIVKHYVEVYEQENKEAVEYEIFNNKSVKQFEEWDGIC